MNVYLNSVPSPVQGRDHDSLNVYSMIQGELTALRLELNSTQHANRKLTQLLNWIATTNPQILDEFQTTATAFDKLVQDQPRGGFVAGSPT